MKITTSLLVIATFFSTFCIPLQQSLAFTRKGDAAAQKDVADSQAYFRQAAQRPKLRDYSKEIAALMQKMTLEEKVGQMTQLEIGQITSGGDSNIEIDPAKLKKVVEDYKVGSILNVNGHALTVDKWHQIIGAIQTSAAKTRLKIPVIYGIDSIHGANYIRHSTLFPQEIGMGATWNPILMERATEIAAMETRAAGIPWSFSPVLDVGRQPLWPRFWETFGEDPYLATVMGVAFVRGLEGQNVGSDQHVASSLKHYVGYSFPLNGRDRTSAWIPERYMREYFLPPFEAAVHAGARTIMVNSAEVNGVPGHINKHLLTDILRGEMKFDGFVVSDWDDINKLVSQWKVAPDTKEATRMAVMAGIDMSMVPYNLKFADELVELVKEGKVPMSRIDEAVERILRVKYELGLFDKPMPDPALKSNFGRPEYAEAALDAARESLVLLKNDNRVLPLAKNKKVLVTGPTADSLVSLNNGWTYVWQGSEQSLYPKDKMTIRQAVEKKVGSGNFKFVQGTKIVARAGAPINVTPTDVNEEVNVGEAVEAAKNSDVIVLCLGEGSYTETPGNITDLTLPETQLKFAEAILATGKPVVAVLVEGRPRIIGRIAERLPGILLALNPGNEGGQAVADVLFGDYNPNGKLPFTYPRTPNSELTYDHKLFEVEETNFGNTAFAPQFKFGHGLSYTDFAYSDLKLSQSKMSMNDQITATVTVKNTGQRAGKETVILYVRDEVATISPAGKRVRRFAKISLDPGQSKTLSFTLGKDDLSFIGMDNKPTVEAGEFTVMIGDLSGKFTLE
ncbi:MAG: glycoside hydrolase family 3 N-terminal domain-containing protein [Pyrinomonadaceae bacterium]